MRSSDFSHFPHDEIFQRIHFSTYLLAHSFVVSQPILRPLGKLCTILKISYSRWFLLLSCWQWQWHIITVLAGLPFMLQVFSVQKDKIWTWWAYIFILLSMDCIDLILVEELIDWSAGAQLPRLSSDHWQVRGWGWWAVVWDKFKVLLISFRFILVTLTSPFDYM